MVKSRRFVLILQLAGLGASVCAAQSPTPPAIEPKDRTSYFRSIVVERGESVADVGCILCSVTVRGTVKGDVGAVWGNVEIEGTVEEDVAAVEAGCMCRAAAALPATPRLSAGAWFKSAMPEWRARSSR